LERVVQAVFGRAVFDGIDATVVISVELAATSFKNVRQPIAVGIQVVAVGNAVFVEVARAFYLVRDAIVVDVFVIRVGDAVFVRVVCGITTAVAV
jgi:hypothetical protein